ncbi:TolB family protein [Microlunatus elymi]|uniref:TolB family protein n=1 Tax=Microlunatus elymi TaxID=2596828 RepID=UPI001D1935A0|nr:biopolymer transporter Tol [Microlunatus elymi]
MWLGGPDLDQGELIFETDAILIEAPNWTLDGESLILNGNGTLWRLAPRSGARLEAIEFSGLPPINNDHVLDPDGEHIYLSAADRHIYRGSLAGGPVTRVTPDDGRWHFLHGVSPDGARLAYVEIEDFSRPGQLMILDADSPAAPDRVPVGDGHLDGPEWSPDGQWIYLNTEAFTKAPGHAQLARVPDGGGPAERLVASDTVDWFPHLSPDGNWASYITFPAGTIGHPADLDVEVRVVSTSDWGTVRQRYPVFGGQGTLNVNSWAPDSEMLAFVAYPRS